MDVNGEVTFFVISFFFFVYFIFFLGGGVGWGVRSDVWVGEEGGRWVMFGIGDVNQE